MDTWMLRWQRARLIELIMSQGASFIPRMGFPNDWMSRKIWRSVADEPHKRRFAAARRAPSIST